jgi:hypothetical protein
VVLDHEVVGVYGAKLYEMANFYYTGLVDPCMGTNSTVAMLTKRGTWRVGDHV